MEKSATLGRDYITLHYQVHKFLVPGLQQIGPARQYESVNYNAKN